MRLLLVLSLSLSLLPGMAASADLTEPVHLFNGENLDGFYTWIKDRGRDQDPKAVFTVADGLLRISGEEWGCVTSVDEYENYHLVAEFKWGDEVFAPRMENTRDNGILINSTGEDGAYSGIWMCGIELQIIEGGTGDLLAVGDGTEAYSLTCPVAQEMQGSSHVYEPGGEPVTINSGRINWWGRDPDWTDTLGFRGAQDVEKPVGEWNTYECIVDDGHLTVILNGVIVNEAIDMQPRKGRIQIQSEGAEIFFRRFDLLPLEKESAPQAAQHRFIYNSDGDNMFIYKDYPMTPEDLYPYIDEIAGTQVTTYFISPNYGMTMIYPSEAGEMIGANASEEFRQKLAAPETTAAITTERGAANMHGLVKSGHDPLGLIVDRAREKGLETFASFRLNEVHAVDKPGHPLLSQFWTNHPEWHIGQPGDPLPELYQQILGPRTHPIVGSWLPGGLNFAVPEVRAHRLAQLREICERYAIDGLDLDFQRFPMYFKPGEEAEQIATMTEWMREVKAMVDEAAEVRGRPVQLCARVMARPEQNLGIGIDPITWANEGIVDFLVVSHYLRNDFDLPIQEYKALLPDGFPVYASIEVEPEVDTYRKMAHTLYANGADGILLFNLFTSRERGEEPLFELLQELGDPETIKLAKRKRTGPLLIVVNKHEDTLVYVDPDTLEIVAKVPTGPDPHELVITPDQRFAYLSNYATPGDTVSVIDLVNKKHIQQIPTGEYTRIHSAALTSDGKFAYFTAGQTGYVVEVDTSTNEVTRGIPTHGEISHMVVVSPDDQRLYTANIETRNVSVIDRATGEIITQVPGDSGCEGITFTPDGKYLWAANQGAGNITVIDLSDHSVSETIACPGVPLRIKFTEDGTRVLITSWEEKGELVVMDVATRTEIKRIPVGNQPIGVEISPDGKRAFVTNMTSDEVHVISMETLEVVDRFVTGKGCDAMAWWYPPEGWS
ncbi:MAG: DUF1080 domain-containing protein [Candidatus Hydrogenedentes bacterium]|nr:DUF1080 domain-containing protein [Candidatus Hydrogenedentota bacterium]